MTQQVYLDDEGGGGREEWKDGVVGDPRKILAHPILMRSHSWQLTIVLQEHARRARDSILSDRAMKERL